MPDDLERMARLTADRYSEGQNMAQFSFDPLNSMDAGLDAATAHKVAQRERNAALRDYRRQNVKAYGWALRGQLRQYKSYGVEDGRVRTVYMLNVADGPYQAFEIEMTDTREKCPNCNGKGVEPWGETCLLCGGQGRVPFREWGKEDDDSADD